MNGGARLPLLALGCLFGLAPAASAQISPGPLSRAHAKLEGSGNCLECHDPGEGVSASKCLACHEPLRKRSASGLGLHARADYRDCRRCHVEHQGVEFALVFWGK
ncbi:MAG: cytochrome c3 family protein, partial [Burkholderiales bacterium]